MGLTGVLTIKSQHGLQRWWVQKLLQHIALVI